jgi:diacylglycerol kinase (ATP)
MKSTKYKFIYNPHSGIKRQFLFGSRRVALDQMKRLLDQYQIPVDFFPTKYPNHAKKLAKEAIQQGYSHVLVAGGDGTIGETANGLIGSDITLGIVPLGSFMNVARMLSIPKDLEKAIQLIKIGRTRKIDVGCVTKIGGRDLSQPHYFLESCGIGLWAQLHQQIDLLEKRKWEGFKNLFHTAFGYYYYPARISIDGKIVTTKAILVTVSNGPYSGASLKIAPLAKLNDHLLTISLYKMSKFELMQRIYYLFRFSKTWKRKVETYQGKHVVIETKVERLVHVDGRTFGKTPVEMTILPSAIDVITGFPPVPDDSALKERTYLEG